MKKIALILTLTLVITGCTFTSETKQSQLPVIDVNKEYPVKRIDIHEIAEVEYIPLQTTEESLIQIASGHAISEDYIIIFDVIQHVFFIYDRQGNFIHSFKRFGLGPEEYYGAVNMDVDFINKRIYTWDGIKYKMFCYGFNGEYLHSWDMNMFRHGLVFHPLVYDTDHLIAYNDTYWPASNEKKYREADNNPFYLINLKDGSIRNIDERLRIKDPVHSIFKLTKGQTSNESRREGWHFQHIYKSGDDFLLMNNALDTLYSYKNHQLSPIMLRTPSAATMDVPKIISPSAYTDSYFMFYILPMDYEMAKKNDFEERNTPRYILDRHSNEIFQAVLFDSLLDQDFNINDKRAAWNIFPNHFSVSMHTKNQALGRYKTELLLEKLEEGKLKGKLKEIASKLKEDDNNVVAIFKFK